MNKEEKKLDSTYLLIERIIDPSRRGQIHLPENENIFISREKNQIPVKMLLCNSNENRK